MKYLSTLWQPSHLLSLHLKRIPYNKIATKNQVSRIYFAELSNANIREMNSNNVAIHDAMAIVGSDPSEKCLAVFVSSFT